MKQKKERSYLIYNSTKEYQLDRLSDTDIGSTKLFTDTAPPKNNLYKQQNKIPTLREIIVSNILSAFIQQKKRFKKQINRAENRFIGNCEIVNKINKSMLAELNSNPPNHN